MDNNELVEKIFTNYRNAWIEASSQNIVFKSQVELLGETINKLEQEKVQIQTALDQSNNKFVEATKQHQHLTNELNRKIEDTIKLYTETIKDREDTIKQHENKIVALSKQVEDLKNAKIPIKTEKQ